MPCQALVLLGLSVLACACVDDGLAGAMDGGTDGAATDAAGDGPSVDADACSGDDCEAPPRDCTRDSDCTDAQRCVGGFCVTAPACAGECSALHPCVELTGACDCEDPDLDGDNGIAIECGGSDCDDGDPNVNRDAIEVCFGSDPTAASRDEDCDPTTFYRYRKGDPDKRPVDFDGDGDGDDHVSVECFNVSKAGRRIGGDDCNDGSSSAHPGSIEVCDDLDNNCNGMVDEREVFDDAGVRHLIPEGLKQFIYPDEDGDGYGDPDQPEATKACFYDERLSRGFVFDGTDCDDGRASDHPGALELCDGRDNDCDGDTELQGDPDFDLDLITVPYFKTEYACTAEGLEVTSCPSEDVLACGDPLDGCTTDATTLTSCRACETDCVFSCGRQGCDGLQELAAGEFHTCARTDEGRIACWGRSLYGRLGHEATQSERPLFNPRIEQAHGVAAGPYGSCAIAGDERRVWCWGRNDEGQLGVGALEQSVVPVQLTTFDDASLEDDIVRGALQVEVSTAHACALLDDGRLLCWGQPEDGRLGNEESEWSEQRRGAAFVRRPLSPLEGQPEDVTLYEAVDDITAFCIGHAHGCALLEGGEVACWGDDTDGQLGDGSASAPNNPVLQPVQELAGVDVQQVACGTRHTCALAAGRVYCWGANGHGQLGPRDVDALGGTPVADDRPGRVAGVEDVEQLALGDLHSCVLSEGAVRCWGSNLRGELGQEGSPSGVVDVAPEALQAGVTRLFAGGRHSCALRVDGIAVCWGSNSFGELGNGRIELFKSPVFEPVLPALASGP